jgi:hypothetical protein
MDFLRRNKVLNMVLLGLLAFCAAPFDTVWCYAGDTVALQVTIGGHCYRCEADGRDCCPDLGTACEQDIDGDAGPSLSSDDDCACSSAPASDEYLAGQVSSVQRAPALEIVTTRVWDEVNLTCSKVEPASSDVWPTRLRAHTPTATVVLLI